MQNPRPGITPLPHNTDCRTGMFRITSSFVGSVSNRFHNSTYFRSPSADPPNSSTGNCTGQNS